MTLRKAILVAATVLAMSSGRSWAQAPASTVTAASRKAPVALSKKDALTSRARLFAASDAPIGNGLTAADPFLWRDYGFRRDLKSSPARGRVAIVAPPAQLHDRGRHRQHGYLRSYPEN
jgi:hypothetical protein